jgi:hypothetical protein
MPDGDEDDDWLFDDSLAGDGEDDSHAADPPQPDDRLVVEMTLGEARHALWQAFFDDEALRSTPTDLPLARWVDGQAVPNLAEVPVRLWMAAIRPLQERARWAAATTVPDEVRYVFSGLARDLPSPRAAQADRVRGAIDEPVGIPAPAAPAPAPPPRVKQVNFRLTRAEHARLDEAAGALGLTLPALAKAFVISGVNRALQEQA